MKKLQVASLILLALTAAGCSSASTPEAGASEVGSTSEPSSAPTTSSTPTTTPEASSTPEGSSTPSTAPETTQPSTSPTPRDKKIATYAVSGVSARCVWPPSPELLANVDVAFEGKVTAIKDDVATVRITRTYAGETGKQAHLSMRYRHSESVTYVKGQAYLIAATDGDVNGCQSGSADDPALQESYQAAFG